MRKLIILVFVFINGLTNLVAQIPYPELIEEIKPSVVGIEAHDDTLITQSDGTLKEYQSYGSGVLITTDSVNIYALTNEHVIAIKDTNERTIRYAKDIRVLINVKDMGSFPCGGKIIKVNEKLDLVALGFSCPDSIKIFGTAMMYKIWEDESNLKEGDIVVYSGFPLGWGMGRGKTNAPLTRTGIISQLIPGSQTFLIDAFVQPGYSGSPVFLLRSKPDKYKEWYYRLIGICKAYRPTFKPVYHNVKLSVIPYVYVSENPGFTIVIGVSAIKQLFK